MSFLILNYEFSILHSALATPCLQRIFNFQFHQYPNFCSTSLEISIFGDAKMMPLSDALSSTN